MASATFNEFNLIPVKEGEEGVFTVPSSIEFNKREEIFRQKQATDFAILCGVSCDENENGKVMQDLQPRGEYSSSLGVAPQFTISFPKSITLKELEKKYDCIKKVEKSNNGEKLSYYTIDLGLFPQTAVSPALEQTLEELYNNGQLKEGIKCTGRYLPQGLIGLIPEFEYNGQKYIRMMGKNEDHFIKNQHKTNKVFWVKEEPISCIILDNEIGLTTPFNELKVESEKIILKNLTLPLDIKCNLHSIVVNQLENVFVTSFTNAFLNGKKLYFNQSYDIDQTVDFRNTGFLSFVFGSDKNKVKTFVVPKWQNRVDKHAFEGCVGLDEIVVPANISIINPSAFNGCRFKYAYRLKGSSNLHFSKNLPNVKEEDFTYVNIDKLLKAFPDFDLKTLFGLVDITSSSLDKKAKLAEKLVKNKFSLSNLYVDTLLLEKLFDDFEKNSEFKYLKSEPILNILNRPNIYLGSNLILGYFNFMHALGCFSSEKVLDKNGKETDVCRAQKSVSLMAQIMKCFEDNKYFGVQECIAMLTSITSKDLFSQDCLNFLSVLDENKKLSNVEMLLSFEKKFRGIFAKVLKNFDEVKNYRKDVDERGKNIVLSWEEAVTKYFYRNVFEGVNDENRDIADEFFKNGVLDQTAFDNTYFFRKYAIFNGVPEHLLGKPLKEKTIQDEVKEIKEKTAQEEEKNINMVSDYEKEGTSLEKIEQIKENTAQIIADSQQLIDEVYEKQFTFEMLSKRDAKNAILGLYCDCCSSIHSALYGKFIAKASIDAHNVQNMVVHDSNGKIIAKGTMYLNKKLAVAVFNDFEIAQKYRESYKSKEKILQTFLRGINAFVKEYDLQHPFKPIKKVTVGMGCSKLREECMRFKQDLSKIEIPSDYNFDDALLEQRILYERDGQKENSEEKNL